MPKNLRSYGNKTDILIIKQCNKTAGIASDLSRRSYTGNFVLTNKKF